MPLIKKYFLCAAFLLIAAMVQSQQFGGNAPSVNWKQVNTSTSRVIFPAGLDSVAKEVISITEQLNKSTQFSLGSKRKKIDIVLQNETTVSNGYVGLGPYRSEFYLTPPQNSFNTGSLPWHTQLAIHEFRHVQQNNNFNVGFSRLFRRIFGEQGQALANSLVVPDWFYEGDAVFNETLVSGQGRGRLPFFFNEYRSIWSAGKSYSWMKLRNGSMRDFTPDHYRLGYMMVAYGSEKYGNDFWKKVTQDAASYKGVFYPFQKAINEYSGKNFKAFRNDAFNHFKSQLPSEDAVKLNRQTAQQHFLADEEYPAIINDSTVLFVKSSYDQVPVFTIRRGLSEKKLRTMDVSIDHYFSYKNGRIVYASYRPDIRWGWKNYSDVKILDAVTGRQRSVTSHSKYFSPDISDNGSTIVAVWVGPTGGSVLHFLDAGNGSVVAAIPNPDHLFYTYPKFYNAKEIISPVRNRYGQMALAHIDGAKGTTDYLTPFSYNVIGRPFIEGDTIYFTASHQGNDRLFACAISDGKLLELKSPKLEGITGNYQPVASLNKLLWSRFTAYGYQLQELDKKEVSFENISAATFAAPLSDFSITALRNRVAPGSSSPIQTVVTNYSKFHRLVNFHSLRPLIDEPVYSLSVIGENVLNTLQSELFVSYNRNEQYKRLGFNSTYGAWFPFVSGGATYTLDRRSLYRNQRIYWNEWEVRAGANLPLNFSKGRIFTRLNTGADFIYNQPNFKGIFKDSLGNRSFGYVNTYLNFTNQVRQARKNIYPRLAQSLLLSYKRAIYNYNANQFLLAGSLYLPGLWTNHSLVLNGAFQRRDTLNQRSFSNSFPFSRGYSFENFYMMKKWGVNYHFPLGYPDAGFGNIVYLLRLRSNVFYDHTWVTNSKMRTSNFRSAGTEVFFDTKWWNQLPLSFGFRYSYLLDRDIYGGSGSNRFELVLPVNLLQQ